MKDYRRLLEKYGHKCFPIKELIIDNETVLELLREAQGVVYEHEMLELKAHLPDSLAGRISKVLIKDQ